MPNFCVHFLWDDIQKFLPFLNVNLRSWASAFLGLHFKFDFIIQTFFIFLYQFWFSSNWQTFIYGLQSRFLLFFFWVRVWNLTNVWDFINQILMNFLKLYEKVSNSLWNLTENFYNEILFGKKLRNSLLLKDFLFLKLTLKYQCCENCTVDWKGSLTHFPLVRVLEILFDHCWF